MMQPTVRVSPCYWHYKGSPLAYDYCNKAMWLVRLVGSMRDGRDFSRVLRIGFCCSEQKRRNLKTTNRCEKQEVRRFNHRVGRPAVL